MQAGVSHTGGKPWAGGETPLLRSGAGWGTTGTPGTHSRGHGGALLLLL